ncbi:hypothetical protein PAPYR_9050 [Paratrimastix pyriformis]|uniref:Protein kinase domain-containing protein n=1 Tax=Paratrimastix pyriformis TaxID=342808 RepID=A0ABQ8UAX5_9EUKA|nr:hypothetical protein PAPYR_9050 [Paratrimastix pyriformis]
MHAYRVVLRYSGPGSGDSPFKRKTLVIATFGPDTPSDTLVEITTLRPPRREGRIPRFRLGGVPKEDDARYIKEYLLTLIPVVGDPPLYRHLPGPSLQKKARPEDPDIIDPYHVLGVGAFGISFKMGDARMGQQNVALKATAAPETDLERAMINNEGYIPAAVHHPNVLPAAGPPLEVQLEPGGPVLRCLLTPFCEGGDLDKVIRRHLRSPSADPDADREERWWLLVDMVRGLAYLHGKPFEQNDRQVLHNDIKPANVLLRPAPDTQPPRLRALLADLGMACECTDGSSNEPLIRGTPGFMAPELASACTAEGQALLEASGVPLGNTPATDVYAMGVTLFCLYSQTDSAHKTEERPSEEELRGLRRAEVVELLVRMCSEKPTDRPDMARIQKAVLNFNQYVEREVWGKACEAEAARMKAREEEAARRKAAEEAARRRAAEVEAALRRPAEPELRLRNGRAKFMVCLAAWLQTNRTVTKVCLLATGSRPSLAAAGSRLATH